MNYTPNVRWLIFRVQADGSLIWQTSTRGVSAESALLALAETSQRMRPGQYLVLVGTDEHAGIADAQSQRCDGPDTHTEARLLTLSKVETPQWKVS